SPSRSVTSWIWMSAGSRRVPATAGSWFHGLVNHRSVCQGVCAAGGMALVTTPRLLEHQLRLAHPVLSAGDAQVDQGGDGNQQNDDEHQQAPVDRPGAGERREVRLPD